MNNWEKPIYDNSNVVLSSIILILIILSMCFLLSKINAIDVPDNAIENCGPGATSC